LGAYITGFVLLALGVVTVNFYVDVTPLPPALQSAWLVIHVFVASLATAFFALGAALSALQLVRARYEAKQMAKARIMNTLPGSSVMESLAYRLNVVGFVMWSFTLIAGAIWAERAWGRYWGWDVKEVWTFIIWVRVAGDYWFCRCDFQLHRGEHCLHRSALILRPLKQRHTPL